MPIVINEIHITAIVNESKPVEQIKSAPANEQIIIAQCVEEILRILKEKQER